MRIQQRISEHSQRGEAFARSIARFAVALQRRLALQQLDDAWAVWQGFVRGMR
jgi:hypothetical protein